MSALHHFRAILLLPFMAAVVIPATILAFTGFDTFGFWHSSPAYIALLALGIPFIGLGLVLMVATIRLFVTVGQGTLAPWNPPQHFVNQDAESPRRHDLSSRWECGRS